MQERQEYSAAGGIARAKLASGTIDEMARRLRAHTRDCVTETYGISLNTWQKLRKGEPVRASVVERLAERLQAEGIANPETILV
ncbi:MULTISPECIES: hypothetical protein [Sphingomonadales]|uniref:hypothetical protein n=1 Tax=Sphingomonadales TaxID=204457 RepID=UPI0006ED34DC|nr:MULTISPECIES: hypothetical protein [Sphingomonadaceae]ALJ12339.1 hypothetical protein LH19_05610 [Sphingopyxis macrogoltabida]MBF5088847.1 hypothetical protein [Novosphingobium sp. NBM11]